MHPHKRGVTEMKKFFAVLAIFALVFTACGDKDSSDDDNKETTTLQIKNQSSKTIDKVVYQNVLFVKENADIVGLWEGTPSADRPSINIAANKTYTAVINGETGSSTWTRNGNNITFNKPDSSQPWIGSGTGLLSMDTLSVTFVDFMNRSSSFKLTSNNLQRAIQPGTSVTKSVGAEGGYIFFSIGSTDYRTSELKAVEENEKAEFIFTDNTIVVNLVAGSTPVALGSL